MSTLLPIRTGKLIAFQSSRTNTIPIEDDSDHEEVRASFG